MVSLNQDTTTARRNGPAEAGPTKTHHNRRTPATKKHAVRVLGRFGTNGVVFPALDFASAREILDQDAGGVNGENKLCDV
ncbi:hypothetical protein OA79_14565 [Marinomonas sp. TW1]|nr:hypothetical protein OA79_14565 [Marinomonas sp. TW1]